MSQYATLKAAITAAIKQNGNNEITGNLLQQQLLAMVNSLGVGYQYAGIATPATNPGTPDQNVFYIAAENGTYANFNGIVVKDELVILKWGGEWTKEKTGVRVKDLGQIYGFPTVQNKYMRTDGTLSDLNGWCTTGWIPIDSIAIVNGKIVLSQATGYYSTSVVPVLFKDANNTVTPFGTGVSASLYSASDIPNGTQYIAFNFGYIYDTININGIGDILNELCRAIKTEIPILTGGYINYDGRFVEWTQNPAYYTDFIEIPIANDTLLLYSGKVLYNAKQWAFYDSAKRFISASSESGVLQTNEPILTIPDGARYIRFSSWETAMSVTMVTRKYLYDLINSTDEKVEKNKADISDINRIIYGVSYDQNGYYEVGTGNFIPAQSLPAKAIGGYLPIADNIDYIIWGHSQYNAALFCLYDENKQWISSYPETASNITVNGLSFRSLKEIPSNAKYIRIGSYDFAYKYDCKIAVIGIEQPKWTGIKWAVVGDSLTAGNDAAPKKYFDFISEKTGISVLNFGVSGTGYAKNLNTNSAFFQRINSIPDDVGLITIFGSGNDLGFLPLGEITDTGTTTLCGCINAAIDAVLEKFPTTPFGIITPTPWFDEWTPDAAPNVMSEYSDALANICKRRGIPCLNLFYCSNLHPNIPAIRAITYKRDGTYQASTEGTPNAIQVTAEMLNYVRNNGVSNAQIGDWVLGTLNGVHPDEDGHKLFAPRIEGFLYSLLLSK